MIQHHLNHGSSEGTDESMTRVNLSVPLMHHDLGDRGSLILLQISPKELTLRLLILCSNWNALFQKIFIICTPLPHMFFFLFESSSSSPSSPPPLIQSLWEFQFWVTLVFQNWSLETLRALPCGISNNPLWVVLNILWNHMMHCTFKRL